MTPSKTSRKQVLPFGILVAVLVLSFSLNLVGQKKEKGSFNRPEALVRALYDEVSFEKGTQPDWDKVRAMFIDEAVITLRTSPAKMTVFSLEGFVEDFIGFIARSKAGEAGFQEKILKWRKTVFGNMANFQVLFSVQFMDKRNPPQKGIDNILIIKKNKNWKIVAITNEFVSPQNPIPAGLKP